MLLSYGKWGVPRPTVSAGIGVPWLLSSYQRQQTPETKLPPAGVQNSKTMLHCIGIPSLLMHSGASAKPAARARSVRTLHTNYCNKDRLFMRLSVCPCCRLRASTTAAAQCEQTDGLSFK